MYHAHWISRLMILFTFLICPLGELIFRGEPYILSHHKKKGGLFSKRQSGFLKSVLSSLSGLAQVYKKLPFLTPREEIFPNPWLFCLVNLNSWTPNVIRRASSLVRRRSGGFRACFSCWIMIAKKLISPWSLSFSIYKIKVDPFTTSHLLGSRERTQVNRLSGVRPVCVLRARIETALLRFFSPGRSWI